MRRAKPLILLVEDQSELRQMYAQQLELSGFDVIQAGNGLDALTHTAAHAPDVVLMDLSLPILDGWEATRRLKTDDAHRAHSHRRAHRARRLRRAAARHPRRVRLVRARSPARPTRWSPKSAASWQDRNHEGRKILFFSVAPVAPVTHI